jgi:DNA-binding response OmpR family regulator
MIASKLEVLFVDDHRETADAFADIATALGHSSSVAYDGATALSLTSGNVYRLIFLDISLGDADGRDICHQIRHGASASARVVAVTGYNDLCGTAEMGIFDDCLVKPVTTAELQRQLAI